MAKIVVRYAAEASGDTFNVMLITVQPDRYGHWMLTDEKKSIIAKGLPKWNAEYAAAALNYFNQKAKAKNKDDIFVTTDLECLKSDQITVDQLAYYYVKDSIGTGWGMHNAYKLTADFMMDMWLKGASYRFGIIDINTDKDVVFTALSDSINRIIDSYGLH